MLPEILWAQRKDKLYITVDLQDCQSPDVKISNNSEATSGRFEFTGKAADSTYECAIDLFSSVDSDAATISYTPRHIFIILPKTEDGDHWPRLTKEKGKQSHIKVDWAKYLDQDEEESGADGYTPDMEGMGGMGGGMGAGGMPGMGGMGGMDMAQLQAMMAAQGGAEGDDKDDSDDEDLPDLEA